MTHLFDEAALAGVLGHMNDDHTDDSLVITRAFAEPAATAATMTGLDGAGGTWDVEVDGRTTSVTIPWTEPAIERADLRREVVRLYDRAVEILGLPAREAH